MNYYRRYVGDYLRDTSRLSMLDHGAYTLLLDYYYSEEQPLPIDRQEIYTMVRAMTADHRKSVDKVLDRYFVLADDGYRNNRADEELGIATKVIGTARENGKLGGRPKTKNITQDETENITENETQHITGDETGTVTRNEPANNHPPTTNHHPPTANRQPPSTNQRRKSAAPPATTGEVRPEVQVVMWLKAHGITAQASDPRVIQFAAESVAEQHIIEAVAIARTRPGKAHSRIHFAYLCGILTDVMHPTAGAKGGASGIDQWLDSQDVSHGTGEPVHAPPVALKPIDQSGLPDDFIVDFLNDWGRKLGVTQGADESETEFYAAVVAAVEVESKTGNGEAVEWLEQYGEQVRAMVPA